MVIGKFGNKNKNLSGESMYLDKENLRNASVEDILKELKIVDEELFCVERSLPSSKSYALRVYSDRLLKEIITRVENLEIKF